MRGLWIVASVALAVAAIAAGLEMSAERAGAVPGAPSVVQLPVIVKGPWPTNVPPSPTATVTPGPCVQPATDLVQNGGFESGWAGWTIAIANPISPSIVSTYFSQGSYSAEFGGVDGASQQISQAVTIPSWATSAALYFDWTMWSLEPLPQAYDFLTVEVLGPSQTVLAQAVVDNNQLQNTWTTSRTSVSIAGYQGQLLAVRITATTDNTYTTQWHVDQVQLVVACGSTVP